MGYTLTHKHGAAYVVLFKGCLNGVTVQLLSVGLEENCREICKRKGTFETISSRVCREKPSFLWDCEPNSSKPSAINAYAFEFSAVFQNLLFYVMKDEGACLMLSIE